MAEKIGKYELGAMLGDGGMGTVYRGIDTVLKRDVAIKMLHPHLTRDGNLLERFRDEAMVQAKLVHPNIVTVYDFVSEGEQNAIIMEFVPGRSLDHVIEQETGPIPFIRCAEIFLPVLDAISFAHNAGIIHRDIKPANVMVSQVGGRDIIKVADFGIAKALGGAKRTATGAKIGTMYYMAPEQVKGASDIDNRADIYALGVTLYEMATARLPFESDNDFELMMAHVNQPPTRPSDRYPGVHAEFEEVILKAMAKSREERYQSTAEFRAAIEGLCVGDISGASGQFSLDQSQKIRLQVGTDPNRSSSPSYGGERTGPTGTHLAWEGDSRASTSAGARKRYALFAIIAIVLLIGAGIAVAIAMGNSQPERRRSSASYVPAPPPPPPPVLTKTAETSAAPPQKAEPEPDEDLITIGLAGVPEGSQVLLDGALVDGTSIQLAKSRRMREIRVEKVGFRPWRRMVSPTQDRSYTVQLQEEPTKEPVASTEVPETPTKSSSPTKSVRHPSKTPARSVTRSSEPAAPPPPEPPPVKVVKLPAAQKAPAKRQRRRIAPSFDSSFPANPF